MILRCQHDGRGTFDETGSEGNAFARYKGTDGDKIGRG